MKVTMITASGGRHEVSLSGTEKATPGIYDGYLEGDEGALFDAVEDGSSVLLYAEDGVNARGHVQFLSGRFTFHTE